jgi:hypothetical protein
LDGAGAGAGAGFAIAAAGAAVRAAGVGAAAAALAVGDGAGVARGAADEADPCFDSTLCFHIRKLENHVPTIGQQAANKNWDKYTVQGRKIQSML